MAYGRERLAAALQAFRIKPSKKQKTCLRELRPRKHDLSNIIRIAPCGPRQIDPETDDEDYDPNDEHRKKKKKVEKRKAAICHEDEVPSKIAKTSDIWDDSPYFTIRFVSKEGRQLLKQIGVISLPKQKHEPQERPPSYFTKHSSYKADQESARDDWEHADRHNIFEDPHPLDIDDPDIGRTTLRSGKSVNKIQTRVSDPSDEMVTGKPLRAELNPSVQVDHARSLIQHMPGSSRCPIEISDDSDDDGGIYTTRSPRRPESRRPVLQYERRRAIPEKQPPSRDSSARHQPTHNDMQEQTEEGPFTITTSYAHPITFDAAPEQCHFCKDYRMGITGIKPLHVTVFRDPENPSQLQEMGDGLRGQGYGATQMCQRCAQRYASIMECHGLNAHAESMPLRNLPVSSTDAIKEYGVHVFRQRKDSNVPRREPLVPACSLCPYPAVAECCKVQGDEFEVFLGGAVSRDGCGLKLCTTCRQLVYGRCGGRLDKAKIESEMRKRKCQFVRADRQLLYRGSLLDMSSAEGIGH